MVINLFLGVTLVWERMCLLFCFVLFCRPLRLGFTAEFQSSQGKHVFFKLAREGNKGEIDKVLYSDIR